MKKMTVNAPEGFQFEGGSKTIEIQINPEKVRFEPEINDWLIVHPYNQDECFKPALINFRGKDKLHYGFCHLGNWINNIGNAWYYNKETSTEKASHEYVKERLIEEAKRRGFKEGVKYFDADNSTNSTRKIKGELDYYADPMLTDGYGGAFFYKGKWATIIESEPTLEEKVNILWKERQGAK